MLCLLPVIRTNYMTLGRQRKVDDIYKTVLQSYQDKRGKNNYDNIWCTTRLSRLQHRPSRQSLRKVEKNQINYKTTFRTGFFTQLPLRDYEQDRKFKTVGDVK